MITLDGCIGAGACAPTSRTSRQCLAAPTICCICLANSHAQFSKSVWIYLTTTVLVFITWRAHGTIQGS